MIRDKPIHISTEVWGALWLLAQSETRSWTDPMAKAPNIYTPDDIADKILREQIQLRWPQLFEFQKERKQAEKQLIESLRTHENKQ